jgi:hypothetical protein
MIGSLSQRMLYVEGVKPGTSEGVCGVPVDTAHFDDSRIVETPEPGREVVVGRFELPLHYCGLFENFSQFIGDPESKPLAFVRTAGLEWRLLINNRPFHPFLRLDHIVNPWGFSCCPVAIRLDENATVEFVVRNVNHDTSGPLAIPMVGGRITGRYWYNSAYGDATPRGGRFG